MVMATVPGVVDLDQVPEQPALPLGRLRHVPGGHEGIRWYADFPQHYAGDARGASAEKGKAVMGLMVEALVLYLAKVKADQVASQLTAEFHQREETLRG